MVAFPVFLLGGLYYLNFLRQSRRPISLALESARKSVVVTNSLGVPNVRKTFVKGYIVSGADYGNADLTIYVAGPLEAGRF
jgi:hypothetical protein